jgi:ATP-binding cassette subfamily B protein
MNSKYELIWQLVGRERLRYGAAIVALVLASCVLYLVPLVPSAVLDGVILANGGSTASTTSVFMIDLLGGRDYLRTNLWLAPLVIAGLACFAALFTYLRGRWAAQATERIVRELRDRLYDQLQHLPCSFYDTAATGDLVQRCTSDVETLRQFLANQIAEIGRAVLMLLVPLPLMFTIDARMAGLSLLLIPVIFGFSVLFFRRVRSSFEEVDKAEGMLTSTLQENLTGIRVVRAFARQEFEIEKFDARNRRHRDLDYGLYRLVAVFWSVSDFLCLTQVSLVVFGGGYWMMNGTLGAGSFFFFLTAVGMFIWPVRMMGRILTELGKATVAIGRVHDILGHPRESAPSNGKHALPMQRASQGEIVFRNVIFSHREGANALEDVSFTVPPGRMLGLLGPSGSGKTSIVSLLLRFYDPASGSIEIDGCDISTLDRKRVREDISVVMQEPFLYSKTVRDNLTVGHAAASHEDISRAAEAACVHGTVMSFEKGYETLVGERGITLSGGQRQRVAIARALLKDPKILILDDALSAVDTDTEAFILDALRRRRGRSTTIVIAHRLSAIAEADEILVLDRGRIVQRGTHASLIDAPGQYQRIWNIQNARDESNGHEIETRT